MLGTLAYSSVLLLTINKEAILIAMNLNIVIEIKREITG
jgi:hypothetical protein